MKINHMAKYSGVNSETIRKYRDRGLLHPEQNPENGYYEYSNADFLHLLYIRKLRGAGLSLDTIAATCETGDSAAILARVRSNIHAIRVINSISAADGGRQLLESERLLTMQNMVDRYLEFLTTGMDTGEYTTSLQTSLLELQDIVAGLE